MSEQVEEWRAVPGFEGLYEVSDWGRVRSLDRVTVDKIGRVSPRTGRILKTIFNGGGYPSSHLSRENNSFRVANHTLVLLAFEGPRPPELQVRHLDGNRKNGRLSNLKYGTSLENSADALAHDTTIHSEAHYRAKLTKDAVVEIRAARGKIYQKELAAMFGVSPSTIGHVQRGDTWNHV